VNTKSLAMFFSRCQFKYGGIAKAPGEHPGTHAYMRTDLLFSEPSNYIFSLSLNIRSVSYLFVSCDVGDVQPGRFQRVVEIGVPRSFAERPRGNFAVGEIAYSREEFSIKTGRLVVFVCTWSF
jgi:hypothetical protein